MDIFQIIYFSVVIPIAIVCIVLIVINNRKIDKYISKLEEIKHIIHHSQYRKLLLLNQKEFEELDKLFNKIDFSKDDIDIID